MRRKDQTTEFLKACIVEAFVQMLGESNGKPVSIQELCKRAGVSRMTFYRHFSDKEALSRHYLSESITNTYQTFDQAPDQAIKLLFQWVESEKTTLKLFHEHKILTPLYDFMAGNIIAPDSPLPPTSQIFVVQGLFGVITDWLAHDCQPTYQVLSKDIFDILNSVYQAEETWHE